MTITLSSLQHHYSGQSANKEWVFDPDTYACLLLDIAYMGFVESCRKGPSAVVEYLEVVAH